MSNKPNASDGVPAKSTQQSGFVSYRAWLVASSVVLTMAACAAPQEGDEDPVWDPTSAEGVQVEPTDAELKASTRYASSDYAVRCTYSPVGVHFPTPGGNAAFSVCKRNQIFKFAQGATVYDPNGNGRRGRTFGGTCSQIDSWARGGHFSNNMCGIMRLRLNPTCCTAPGGNANAGNWTYH